MRPKQSLLGKSFGKLIVISEAPKHKNDFAPYWKCKCECGNITDVRAQHLTDGVTKTCGGLHHRTGSAHYKWKGCGEVSGRYICDLKKHARERKLSFKITATDLWNLFIRQNKCCALTGQPISFGNGSERYKNTTASLDRIDSNKGYVNGNIQWVHKDINWFKRDYPQDKFLSFCKMVSDYNRK